MEEKNTTQEKTKQYVRTGQPDKKAQQLQTILKPTKILMENYYTNWFPSEEICKWLQLGDKPSHRELSIVLLTNTNDEIFCRYLNAKNVKEQKKILYRQEYDKYVSRIELGPEYNIPINEISQYKNTNIKDIIVKYKELVFDIDIDSYDSIRTCCKDKKQCNKCQIYLKAAIKVLYKILKDDFGYIKILFVYSGRRGIHCWVLDNESSRLCSEARNALLEYISIRHENIIQYTIMEQKHPLLQQVYTILLPIFEELLITQELFIDRTKQLKLLSLGFIDSSQTNQDIRWPDTIQLTPNGLIEIDPISLWRNIVKLCYNKEETRYAIMRIVQYYLYPRFDSNVTKQLNHLLKLPFCIHPSTGSVCIPLDISTIDTFSLDTVPTLYDLLNITVYEDSVRSKIDIFNKSLKYFTDVIGTEAVAASVDMDIDADNKDVSELQVLKLSSLDTRIPSVNLSDLQW